MHWPMSRSDTRNSKAGKRHRDLCCGQGDNGEKGDGRKRAENRNCHGGHANAVPASGVTTITRDAQDAHVKILLALYNGAPNLDEQLDSFVAQTHRNWSLLVSDDGSVDAGLDIVRRFARRAPEHDINLTAGPRKGFARNFLHLLQQAGEDCACVALSDQDDVWLPEKIADGVSALARVPQGLPGLYCSRTMICDSRLAPQRPSPLFCHPPGFRNALVQNIAGGNTMVLNRAALDILQAAAAEVGNIVAHDWWIYQMVSGAGGQVIYDAKPGLLYRQHAGNQIGANDTIRASMRRARMMLGGRFSAWNTINIRALMASAHRLTLENRDLLTRFGKARQDPLPHRIAQLRRLRVYRQTRRGNAGLWLAALINRI